VKIRILVGALALSVGLNIWQLWQANPSNTTDMANYNNENHRVAPTLETLEQADSTQQSNAFGSFATSNLPRQTVQNQEEETERQTLLKQASAWLDSGEWLELRLFLQGYLQTHPQDWDFVLVEARLNVQTELLSDAIANYYSLRKLPLSPPQQQEVEEQLLALTNQTINQLQLNRSFTDGFKIFL